MSLQGRFIPARAGNAPAAASCASTATVHPRAGGERLFVFAVDVRVYGSSPRGRGTPTLSRMLTMPSRFIPARAGNATSRSCQAAKPTVHPRAGGERAESRCPPPSSAGSSPRGRGTQCRIAEEALSTRFIPARAGNAAASAHPSSAGSAHPRAGGERDLRDDRLPARPRFIPARAGNAHQPTSCRCATSVHPRAGGERMLADVDSHRFPGSSPRGRGTLVGLVDLLPPRRFIPARAGNATPRRRLCRRPPVHPRAGGERDRIGPSSTPAIGSSPRGRGTPVRAAQHQRDRRFIPARAGNASSARRPLSRRPVHPRAGGERTQFSLGANRTIGSSPRGRGTRRPPQPFGHVRRFIPARAGNAASMRLIGAAFSVHPRAGGERPDRRHAGVGVHGSSPRGRGTPMLPEIQNMLLRFIPARAGNAVAEAERPVPPLGSSPRGRGTQGSPSLHDAEPRFIPARAGNARAAAG